MARSKAATGREWKGPGQEATWEAVRVANEEDRPEGAPWEWAPRNAIVLKPDLSPRTGLDAATVAEYRETWDQLPPIMVQKGTWVIIDGFHRFEAGKDRDIIKIIEVDVADGVQLEDAAFLANVTHGLRLRRREHINAAKAFFLRHLDWTNTRVADVCSVARGTVIQWRDTLSAEAGTAKVSRKPAADSGPATFADGTPMSPDEADVFGTGPVIGGDDEEDEDELGTPGAPEGDEEEAEEQAPEAAKTTRVRKDGSTVTVDTSKRKKKGTEAAQEPAASPEAPEAVSPGVNGRDAVLESTTPVDWTDPDYANKVGYHQVVAEIDHLIGLDLEVVMPALWDFRQTMLRAKLEQLVMWCDDIKALA